MVLLIDPSNGEPYLELPEPHSSIRLTPPRLSDAPAIAAMMNDPFVYPFLIGPPFPYLEQDAVEYLQITKHSCDVVFDEIKGYLNKSPQQIDPNFIASGAPVKSIREVQEDGSELYIGDLSIGRSGYEELGLIDIFEREQRQEENSKKPVGDPSIDWTLGDCLVSSHHGRGIMTAALHTLIQEWVIPHMKAHRLVATAFVDNIGSHRVFLKNGFVNTGTVAGIHAATEMEAKGRVDCSLSVFEWRASTKSV